MKLLTFHQHRQARRQVADNRNRLYRIAFSWTHNASLSDDLVQEALTKALKNIGQLRDMTTLQPWLYRILANCWRDYLRRERQHSDVDELVLADHDTPEFRYEQLRLTNSVRRAVAGLPMAQRMVVTLVDLQGASYAEVAAILEIPVGTVMSRLCRARKTLAKILMQQQTHHATDNVRTLR
jgi:RNA polymerase sigma-70 factor (ECF subfamily)